MALLRTNIHKALAGHLNTGFSLATNIVWENVPKSVDLDSPYFEELFMPNDSEQRTLGSAGETEDFGLYQINVNVPIGTSTLASEEYIEEISILFKSGTILSLNGVEILIEKSTPAQGYKQDNWYTTPITISWSCYLPIN